MLPVRRYRAVEPKFSSIVFPSSLLSLLINAESLGGVEVSFAYLDPFAKAHTGDGADIGTLQKGESLDFFVSGPSSSTGPQRSPFPNALYFEVSPRRPLFLKVSWERTDERDDSGQIGFLWSFEDWVGGRPPLTAEGAVLESMERYMFNEGIFPRDIPNFGRRVRHLTRTDIKRRISTRRIAMEAENDDLVRVEHLEIGGLRGFRDPQSLRLAQPNGHDDGSGLTIVVGANNAGKSTIWEAFDAVARKRKGGVSFSEGRRNRRTPSGVHIAMHFSNGSSYVVKSQNINTSETEAIWGPSRPSIEPKFEIVSVPSRRHFQASFGKMLTAERDWMSNGQDFSRNQQRDQFTGRLFELHDDPIKKAAFDNLLAEVVGHELHWSIDLSDGQFGTNYYLKISTAEDVTHSSEGLGDGIISLLFILNALYDSVERTLLVIDEPELSLHPQVVRRLGRVIARYASDRQIVVLTHSPLLVSWDFVETGAEIARVFKSGADSRIAQVSREVVDDLAKARGGWKNPHVLGAEANEALFLDDKIIVVEGQEDVGLLPRVFEQTGVTQGGTIFGWGSGGGDGNPQRIVALLSQLGFEKVVTLLDHDKSDAVEKINTAFPNYLALSIPADDIRDKPARSSDLKEGLMDERGKFVKPELIADAREVLTRVGEYLLAETAE